MVIGELGVTEDLHRNAGVDVEVGKYRTASPPAVVDGDRETLALVIRRARRGRSSVARRACRTGS